MTRTGPQARSIIARYSSGRSRPSLRTARLITDQVTSTGRTRSTSIIQRDVIHAHGQSGSNQNSAEVRVSEMSVAVTRPILPSTPGPRPSGGPHPGHPCEDGRRNHPTEDITHTRAGAPLPGKNLTRDEAVARAAVVSVDHYDVTL